MLDAQNIPNIENGSFDFVYCWRCDFHALGARALGPAGRALDRHAALEREYDEQRKRSADRSPHFGGGYCLLILRQFRGAFMLLRRILQLIRSAALYGHA